MWWIAMVWADPGAGELRAAWDSVPGEAWVLPLRFSEGDWARLAAGKRVKRRDRLDGPDRVVGARWVPQGRDALWLSIQDEGHWEVVSGYVDEDLPGSTFADRTLYQRIGLPWPFADRQWVVHVRSNRSLLRASDGRIWERAWELSPRRGASVEDPDAVWVDANEGAWVLVEVGAGTLVVYHTRASVSGNIPDEAATQWALMTVSGMIDDVADRARDEVRGHYVAGHDPIERPDGTFIAPF